MLRVNVECFLILAAESGHQIVAFDLRIEVSPVTARSDQHLAVLIVDLIKDSSWHNELPSATF